MFHLPAPLIHSAIRDEMSQPAKNISPPLAGDTINETHSFDGRISAAQTLGVEGVEGEIGCFLKDHYPRVVAMLRRRTGSREVAEDLAQESAMRLLRYRDLQWRIMWMPIFYRIARNAFNDWGRQQNNILNRSLTPLGHEIGEQIPDPGADIDRLHDAREQLSLVVDAIESLPPKCRQVFLLSRSAGMSNQAIAQRCGISVRMVEKQISKALVICRRSLEGPSC